MGFGDLFNNISLARYNPDGSEQERIVVPIAYASKQTTVQRLESDPDLAKKIQLTSPRLSFEMKGITYDQSRKQNTNIKAFKQTPLGVISQYNPVPYDFDFSLYIYVKNIEDGTQIIEHILPFFTPDYTIKLNLIPEMGIVKEIPITLKDVEYEVQSEGDMHMETRIIIWTLNFTVKGFIFGAVTDTGLIRNSIVHISTNFNTQDTIILNMNPAGNGSFHLNEVVYQGYSVGTATASAQVVKWTSNNQLYITNVTGHFLSTKMVIGLRSDAKYSFSSYGFAPPVDVTIDVKPNPLTANADSNYTYTTTITENS